MPIVTSSPGRDLFSSTKMRTDSLSFFVDSRIKIIFDETKRESLTRTFNKRKRTYNFLGYIPFT